MTKFNSKFWRFGILIALVLNIFWLNFIRDSFSTKIRNLIFYSFGNNKNIQHFDKYISCSIYAGGRLGNQMFRFASLYAIRQKLNRSAFFHSASQINQEMKEEIKDTFPNLFYHIPFLTPINQNNLADIKFGDDCCRYYNSNILNNLTEKYLILSGHYFASYKFFETYKNETKFLFDFNQNIKDSVEIEKNELFKNDSAHKLCIHIRRGDFVDSVINESTEEFIIPAISFLYKNFNENQKIPNENKISLIFIGDDSEFIKNLNFNQTMFNGIYHPKFDSRAKDMYFGTQFCDSFLISASASTFAWWIAYLLPDKTPIFYNGQLGINHIYKNGFVNYDFFPANWIALIFDNSTNTIKIDNRWEFERSQNKKE